MTYQDLKNELDKMTPEQLAKPVSVMLELTISGINYHPYVGVTGFFDSAEPTPVLLANGVDSDLL